MALAISEMTSLISLDSFLLAKLCVKLLCSYNTFESFLDDLSSGPETLEKAYEKAINMVASQNGSRVELARKVFSWLSVSPCQMTFSQLQRAFDMDPRPPHLTMTKNDDEHLSIGDIIAACCGLVTVYGESNIVQLLHPSLREYLAQNPTPWLASAEAEVGKVCMTYLSQAKFEVGSCRTENELEERLLSNPLYEYAAKNWGRHLGNSRLALTGEDVTFLASQPKIEAACQAAMAVDRYVVSVPKCNRFAKKMSSIHVAAYAGADSLVAALLKNPHAANVINLRDSHGHTPLSWASKRGHAAVVELLLRETDAKVNLRNGKGQTSLCLAAEYGHHKVAQMLLDHGANTNLKDLGGNIPLWCAAKEGHASLVQLLLACLSQTRPNNDNNLKRSRAFSIAVQSGHAEVVKLLLDEEDVDFNQRFADKARKDWGLFGFVISSGYEQIAEHILMKLGIPKWSAESKEELLHLAAENGAVRTARLLLCDHAVDPNCRREEEEDLEETLEDCCTTPLMSACAQSRIGEGIVRLLLETKAIQPDMKNYDGRTALSIAAGVGNDAAVQVLLERKNVDPDSRDNTGRTPLSHAVFYAHKAVVQRLLQVPGIDLNSEDVHGTAVLWEALTLGMWEKKKGADMVQQLLATGRVDLNRTDFLGQTPLHVAAKWKDEKPTLIQQCLNHPEMDPDAKCQEGFTPVLRAALAQNWAPVRLLLESGRVDINQQVPESLHERVGATILSLAADAEEALSAVRYQESIDIIKLLLSMPAIRADLQDSHGATPLSRAALCGNVSVVELLLAAPLVDPNTADARGRTPLSNAASAGKVEVVRLLLGVSGINIEPRDTHGQTPLSLAAAGGHAEVVAELLAVDGIDPNSRDLQGRSPLSWAMPSDNMTYSIFEKVREVEKKQKVVSLLAQCSRVDPNAEDKEGWTPLRRALQAHRADGIVELLLSRKDLNLRQRDANGRTPLMMAREKGEVVTKLIQQALRLSAVNGEGAYGPEDQVEEERATNSKDEPATSPVFDELQLRHRQQQAGYVRDEWEREVWIKLEPQHTEDSAKSGSADTPRLCIKYKAIDLTNAFSVRPNGSSGRVIADLGRLDQSLDLDTCDFCRLVHAVRPQSATETPNQELQLRAFSSTNIWLCENAMACHDRFMTAWIDTVFLAVVPAKFSVETGDYPEFYLSHETTPCNKILSTGFISRVGSNCSSRLRALSVSPPSSKLDYGLLRSWIDGCLENHSHLAACNSPSLPSMTAIPHFRLIDCKSRTVVSPSSPVPFVALSYVWGVVPTVQGARPASSISLDDGHVENVVEDAILVTMGLGYTHLWVDRHCIFQENEEVKAVQLRYMNAVYQAAEVTIVAAAGDDSSFGLLGVGKRRRKAQVSGNIHGHLLTVIPPDPSRQIKTSKWATRGWTYQEGLLSRRRLFFTEHEVSYECAGLLCREAIALPAHIQKRESTFSQRMQESSWLFPREPISAVHLKRKVEPPPKRRRRRKQEPAPTLTALPKALFYRLSEYTARNLSHESDVLNAMLGIFQVYGSLEHQPVHHLCGIPIQPSYSFEPERWDDEARLEWFVGGLGWSLLKPSRRRIEFPSWSWTGWKGVVAPPSLRDVAYSSLDPSQSTSNTQQEPLMEVSILEQDKPPLPWHEYATLPNTEKVSTFRQSHVLQLSAWAV